MENQDWATGPPGRRVVAGRGPLGRRGPWAAGRWAAGLFLAKLYSYFDLPRAAGPSWAFGPPGHWAAGPSRAVGRGPLGRRPVLAKPYSYFDLPNCTSCLEFV